MVMQISTFMQDLKISVPLDYVGKRTLNIMVWHFLSFKLLTLLLATIGVMSQPDLLAFPVPHSAQHGWWILYSVVGTAIPLTIEQITDHLYRSNHNKHHPT
jgi:fucose 4-O-acetylase-like acetyltransferase